MPVDNEWIRAALLLVVAISGPPLVAAACSGLVIAVLQAVTQVQEQSVAYLGKVVCVGAVVWLLRGWFCELLIDHFQQQVRLVASRGSDTVARGARSDR